MVVALILSDGYGPGGMNLVILQHWILRFEEASANLWMVVTSLLESRRSERHTHRLTNLGMPMMLEWMSPLYTSRQTLMTYW